MAEAYNRALIFDGVFGNVWSTPGTTNIGIPNWSETVITDRLARFVAPGNITQIDLNASGLDVNSLNFFSVDFGPFGPGRLLRSGAVVILRRCRWGCVVCWAMCRASSVFLTG